MHYLVQNTRVLCYFLYQHTEKHFKYCLGFKIYMHYLCAWEMNTYVLLAQ